MKLDKSVNIKRKNGVLWLYQCLIMEKSVIEKKEHSLILNIKKNKNKFDATLTTQMLILYIIFHLSWYFLSPIATF